MSLSKTASRRLNREGLLGNQKVINPVISECRYYIPTDLNPYRNIALEAYLLETVPRETCVLYLWQNRRTVVVGRNQNSWAECRVNQLESDGGFLARRLSGGGAVYHDEQNLNFTFLMHNVDYDVPRQLEVVLRAIRSFALNAEKTGRNDLTIDGRKFSGNAFYKSGDFCYHHGTLLIDTDTEAMHRYLSVAPEKLQGKGVASVKSRVVNLKGLCPTLTVSALREALITAFGRVYDRRPNPLDATIFNSTRIEQLENHFASWGWRFGRNIPFTWKAQRRFTWGGIQLQFLVEHGKVSDAQFYSDAMAGEFIRSLPAYCIGRPFDARTLAAVLSAARSAPLATPQKTPQEACGSPEEKEILSDIQHLITEELQ